MISVYLARTTWLHRAPAAAKLAGLAAISVALLPVEDWRILLACLACVLALYLPLGREALRRIELLRPLLPLLLLIAALQVLFAGWPAAVTVTARLLVMVMLADLVTATTTMREMMDAISPLLRPLRLAGMRPDRLALAVALVLRFVPLLLARWRAREEAWRARSLRRVSWPLAASFIVDTLRMADHVAEALDARSLDRRPGRSR